MLLWRELWSTHLIISILLIIILSIKNFIWSFSIHSLLILWRQLISCSLCSCYLVYTFLSTNSTIITRWLNRLLPLIISFVSAGLTPWWTLAMRTPRWRETDSSNWWPVAFHIPSSLWVSAAACITPLLSCRLWTDNLFWNTC